MHRRSLLIAGFIAVCSLLSACSGKPPMVVAPASVGIGALAEEIPELDGRFVYGDWCTNREETAVVNQENGFSGLLNVEPVFWRFEEDGTWKDSVSGFIYERTGSWKIEGMDRLTLERKGGEAISRRVQFKNSGADLVLIDDENQVKVLKRCK